MLGMTSGECLVMVSVSYQICNTFTGIIVRRYKPFLSLRAPCKIIILRWLINPQRLAYIIVFAGYIRGLTLY